MLTDDDRAEARARRLAALDALPPPSEELLTRLRELNASIALRKARDRARTAVAPPGTPNPADDLASPSENPLAGLPASKHKVAGTSHAPVSGGSAVGGE